MIYVVALGSLIYGMSSLPGLLSLVLVLGGLVMLFVFVKVEHRLNHPVLNLKIFEKNSHFIISNIVALLNYIITFSLVFLLSLYLQYIKGVSATFAGLILVTEPAVMAIVSPFAGRLADKYQARYVASLGLFIVTIGLFLLSLLSSQSTLHYLALVLFMIGMGFGLFTGPNMHSIMSSVQKKYSGLASAMAATMRQTGQAVSMGVVALLFALYIGKVQIMPENYPEFLVSMQLAFLIFALIGVLAVVLSYFRGDLNIDQNV